jgi:hypothetical protein
MGRLLSERKRKDNAEKQRSRRGAEKDRKSAEAFAGSGVLRRKIDATAQAEYKERNKVLHRGVRKMYEQRARDGGKS